MNKWGIFKNLTNGRDVFRIIQTPDDAHDNVCIQAMIMKYGEREVLPAVINYSGGWSKLDENDFNLISIIESDTCPKLSLGQLPHG